MISTLSTLFIIIPNTISLITCLWFFYCYFKTNPASLSFRMVVTLSISDFILHIMILIIFFVPSPTLMTIGIIIVNLALRFSIFWILAIAFFLYRLTNIKKPHYPSAKYFSQSLVATLLASIITTLLYQHSLYIISNYIRFELLNSQGKLILYLTLMLPLILSVFGSTFFYFRSIAILKKNSIIRLCVPGIQTKSLYLHIFAQLLTIGPGIICMIVDLAVGMPSEAFVIIINLSLGFTGFANASVYYFLKRKSLGSSATLTETTDPETIDEISRSLRNILIVEAFS